MITIRNLIMGYSHQKIGPMINGYIESGNMIAVIGPNGIGKSTFLKTLAGLLSPYAGELDFGSQKRPSISYLSQKKNIDCNVPITIFDVVSMGCWPNINFFKGLNKYQKCLIWSSLKQVKLLNLLHRRVDSLSGGQFQRMLFARILVQQASLVLLDEPFQDIDSFNKEILMRILIRLNQNGCTIIVVLHDDKLIFKYFSKVLLLDQSSSIWKSFS